MTRRRCVGWSAIAMMLAIDVYATGFFGGSERALAIARTLVLPGIGFLEWDVSIGIGTILLALAGLAAWLRWGMDWLPLLIMAGSVAVAAFVMPLHHGQQPDSAVPVEQMPGETHPQLDDGACSCGRADHLIVNALCVSSDSPQSCDKFIGEPRRLLSQASYQVVRSSHEFTLVLVLFAMFAKLRMMFNRLPGSAWARQHVPLHWSYPANDIARASAIYMLAGSNLNIAAQSLKDPHLLARARRVNRWARFRFSKDPLRLDHGPLRAALALSGQLAPQQIRDFCAQSRSLLAGVPATEPTWVRPLDAMLAALALDKYGERDCVERFRFLFQHRFRLHGGCRPAAVHAPTMLALGTTEAWEHAAATALGRNAGWLPDEDWVALRPRCLGAAGGGAADPQTLRLVAAGKLWATLTQDLDAFEILQRRTIEGDPLACALNSFTA